MFKKEKKPGPSAFAHSTIEAVLLRVLVWNFGNLIFWIV
jgi:hypothetical protein